ncbi:MAG: DNA-3-methyladenine glycosylase 2 family protein [Lachnospiraceae bacterium]|nr:DNA-3-methyladenine glycosylase 2 family protein [Lachnospiraceae bacterium]
MITIEIKDDFDLYKIAYSGQCFRVRELNTNSFLFVTGDNYVVITKTGTSYDISCSSKEWDSIWSHYFDFETSYENIRSRISKNDTFIKRSSILGEGIRILNQDKFEMLISFIISQRKSIPAIKSSVEKLCKRWGRCISKEYDLFTFPTPEELSRATSDELNECGLGYRTPYIIEAVKAVFTKEIDLGSIATEDDETLFSTLKSFYGVGDKVANCVLLFGYHRLGRAPIDTWIAKVIHDEYNGINPFPQYGEVAGVMQQYVFYASQHLKELDGK